MKYRILPGLILLLLVAGSAQAATWKSDPRTDTWEFSLQTRYTWAKDFDTGNGSSVKLEDDLGWGFAFGYNVSEQLNLGLAFTWRSVYYNATVVSATNPDDTRVYGNYLDTSTIAGTAEYLFGHGRIKPYVAGNLGWLLLNTNITADIDTGCWYYPYWGYVCSGYASTYGTDTVTYGLGVGLRFDITPKAFLKAGWDHNWNDLDSIDSSDFLRIDLGFML